MSATSTAARRSTSRTAKAEAARENSALARAEANATKPAAGIGHSAPMRSAGADALKAARAQKAAKAEAARSQQKAAPQPTVAQIAAATGASMDQVTQMQKTLGITASGRAATGDNGHGHQPKAQPKSQPKPKAQPKPKPATLGQSGYRAKFGLNDKQMLAAIKSYAKANYDKGGWDVLVEAWDDEKILETIGWATKLDGALRKLRPVLGVVAEVRADAQATAG